MKRLIVTFAIVTAAIVLSAGCGATYIPKTPADAAAYTHAIATRTLTLLGDAGTVASDLRKVEQSLRTQHVITDAQYAAFEGARCDGAMVPAGCVERGFLKLQHQADTAIAAIAKGDLSVSQIAAAVQPVWDAANQVKAGGQVQFGTLLALLQAVLALVGVK